MNLILICSVPRSPCTRSYLSQEDVACGAEGFAARCADGATHEPRELENHVLDDVVIVEHRDSHAEEEERRNYLRQEYGQRGVSSFFRRYHHSYLFRLQALPRKAEAGK